MSAPTAQELFDRAARGLRSQGFVRAGKPDPYSPTGFTCQYNGQEEETHCAAGWLITDISIRSDDNGLAFGDLYEEYDAVRERVKSVGRFWVSSLQKAHDQGTTPALMWSRLKQFAQDHGLDTKELGESPL